MISGQISIFVQKKHYLLLMVFDSEENRMKCLFCGAEFEDINLTKCLNCGKEIIQQSVKQVRTIPEDEIIEKKAAPKSSRIAQTIISAAGLFLMIAAVVGIIYWILSWLDLQYKIADFLRDYTDNPSQSHYLNSLLFDSTESLLFTIPYILGFISGILVILRKAFVFIIFCSVSMILAGNLSLSGELSNIQVACSALSLIGLLLISYAHLDFHPKKLKLEFRKNLIS